MVKFTNEIAKRCARWILLETSPAPLPMLHPVRDDMAAAADEIDRLQKLIPNEPQTSAATSEAGDPIRWIKDTYLMWLKGDLDPAHMRLGQHFFRAQPQVAPTQPFYGARCAAYPNCSGGCGCGCTHEIGDVEARIAVLSDALKRISKNTCCDNCQEAARVARSALGAYVGLARQPEPLSRSSAGNVELLIENLIQSAVEYENNCDRLVAKTIRVELEKAKQAIRDALTLAQPQAAPNVVRGGE
jgi:hypothetical protein